MSRADADVPPGSDPIPNAYVPPNRGITPAILAFSKASGVFRECGAMVYRPWRNGVRAAATCRLPRPRRAGRRALGAHRAIRRRDDSTARRRARCEIDHHHPR
jgi:hypothetical protein